MEEVNVIFNGVFGSHLYGLSTPSSDLDYKGVYMPNYKELVFNDYKECVDKQTKDVDYTYYAITKFLKILEKCDTVSIDMIHTPKEFTLTSSPLWVELQNHRSNLYCKNMRGILGYIKTQTAKYTHKVERYEELQTLTEILKSKPSSMKLSELPLQYYIDEYYLKHCSLHPATDKVQATFDVHGARYQLNASVEFLLSSLLDKLNRYGKRTHKGSVSGGDWKSLSHAYRVLLQLDEIIHTRNLVFPLKYAPDVMKVKLGEHTQEYVINQIDYLYEKTIAGLEASDLPDDPNIEPMKDLVLDYVKSIHN